MNRKKNTTSVPTLPQSKINQSLLVPPPQIMSPNQSYSTYIPPEPKFDPNDYITGSTTKRDIILYKEIFDFWIQTTMEHLQVPANINQKQIIYQMIADFDQDQSGIIEFREFVRMMSMHPGEKDTDEDFENIFYQFDLDYKGYITIDDLREMASECNENLKDEDLENIIKACDPEGNGTIRKQGFIRYMKSLQKKIDDIYKNIIHLLFLISNMK